MTDANDDDADDGIVVRQAMMIPTAPPPEEEEENGSGHDGCSRAARRASFQMFTALETKEEFQKVRLAGFLKDLLSLAEEEKLRSVAADKAEARALMRRRQQSGDDVGDDPPAADGSISLRGIDLKNITPEEAKSKIEAMNAGEMFDSDSLISLVWAAEDLLVTEDTVVDLRRIGADRIAVVGDLHGSLDCLCKVLEIVGDLNDDDDASDQKKQDAEKPTWKSVKDPKSGRTYYYHVKTRKTSWKKPKGFDREQARLNNKKKPPQAVVFDGDFVDRGPQSLEVLCTLMLLKLCHPQKVVLLRGNHEDASIASVYGFQDELEEKYDERGGPKAAKLWKAFTYLFAAFPVCARTKNSVIMHGGIPKENFLLDDLAAISSATRCEYTTVVHAEEPEEELIEGVLWSDPAEEEDQTGITENPRGAGVEFGLDVAGEFLKRHDLKYLIRAHQVKEEGTEVLDCGDGNGDGRAVITVFSNAAYPHGDGSNFGAVLFVDNDGTHWTAEFSLDEANDSLSKSCRNFRKSQGALYEDVLKSFVTDNRTKLAKAFRSVAEENNNNNKDNNGDGDSKHEHDGGNGGKNGAGGTMITASQWAAVVGEQLALPDVPWKLLQPTFAPVTDPPDGIYIDWQAFLNRFSPKLPRMELLDENHLAVLHEHRDKCLNIFKLLDKDGDGTVSEDEFLSFFETLKKENLVDEESDKFENPNKVFKEFDVDGDGLISIDEFCQVLGQSATLQTVLNTLDSSQIESLQQNHEMLLVAFKYLDTDRSGSIDCQEFQRGVDLLNKRLPPSQKIYNPDELFSMIDLDKNGEIDLDEFQQIFRCM